MRLKIRKNKRKVKNVIAFAIFMITLTLMRDCIPLDLVDLYKKEMDKPINISRLFENNYEL